MTPDASDSVRKNLAALEARMQAEQDRIWADAKARLDASAEQHAAAARQLAASAGYKWEGRIMFLSGRQMTYYTVNGFTKISGGSLSR